MTTPCGTVQLRRIQPTCLALCLAVVVAWPHVAVDATAWHISRMLEPRDNQAAVILSPTKLLILGGEGPSASLFAEATSTAEVFNTGTRHWSTVGSMSVSRVGMAAVKLPNGRVMVAGGQVADGYPLSSAETFSRQSNRWKPAASMSRPAQEQTATLLNNGLVLVAGGIVSGHASSQALLYDSRTNRWNELRTCGMRMPATSLCAFPMAASSSQEGPARIPSAITLGRIGGPSRANPERGCFRPR